MERWSKWCFHSNYGENWKEIQWISSNIFLNYILLNRKNIQNKWEATCSLKLCLSLPNKDWKWKVISGSPNITWLLFITFCLDLIHKYSILNCWDVYFKAKWLKWIMKIPINKYKIDSNGLFKTMLRIKIWNEPWYYKYSFNSV